MGPLAPFKLDVFPSMGIHAHGCDLCMNVMIIGLSLKGRISVIVPLRVSKGSFSDGVGGHWILSLFHPKLKLNRVIRKVNRTFSESDLDFSNLI